MYNQLRVKSRIRVPPKLFSDNITKAVEDSIKEEFENSFVLYKFIDKLIVSDIFFF